MIDKANVIYDRWSACYELPTVVLVPNTSDDGCDTSSGGTNAGGSLQHLDHYGTEVSQYGVKQQSEPDPFARFHPRLVQCIVEIHQRAKSLLLSRNASQPPTWGPTPEIHSPCSPVLPPEVPPFARMSYSQDELGSGSHEYSGMSSSSFYSNTVPFPQWAPSTSMDTINFELGALNDQSLMAFF